MVLSFLGYKNHRLKGSQKKKRLEKRKKRREIREEVKENKIKGKLIIQRTLR